jgi:HAD superfamily hydrolase (TIGR01509 family)
MIQCILYDLDGVLVDACEWHYLALNSALKQVCNYEIDYKEHIFDYNGIPTKTKLSILERKGIIKQEQFEQIFILKQQFTKEIIYKNSHIDNYKIKLHLWTKQQGIISACVTNAIRETAEIMLKQTGQFDFMEFILSNEDVKENKPSPECYIVAMEKLHLKPENVLIIEDSDKGYKAAVDSCANTYKVKTTYDVVLENIIQEVRKYD